MKKVHNYDIIVTNGRIKIKIKNDLDRFASVPNHSMAGCKQFNNNNNNSNSFVESGCNYTQRRSKIVKLVILLYKSLQSITTHFSSMEVEKKVHMLFLKWWSK